MTTRTLADALHWTKIGTALFAAALDQVSGDLSRPSPLPGWTRAHIVAHVSANAEAITNLIEWASTGVPSPMYASAERRLADIARGARLSATELSDWFRASARRLDEALGQLDVEQWSVEVQTAQGRTVPASEAPWMRAREVMVHAVDLDAGVSFGVLPTDFLLALRADITDRRGDVPVFAGPLPEVVAHLAGRASRGVTTEIGDTAALLSPWL